MSLAKLGLNLRAHCTPINFSLKYKTPIISPSIFNRSRIGIYQPIISKRLKSNLEVKRHIPGEDVPADNSLSSRLPKFPFRKETIPTLLPKPGVPQVGPNMTFGQMILILKNKEEPELIYESEPHRLYFVMLYSLALVFAVYGLSFFEWASSSAYAIYQTNEQQLSELENTYMFLGRLGVNVVLFSLPAAVAIFAFCFPSRLVRRMYYLPGPIEHVKFTTHPIIPGRPTPVYTVPLSSMTRDAKTKVWTGRGFYGTISSSTFFYFLKEHGHRLPWVVDRKGFFWGDGRVHDFLFGKESVPEAERGLSYDDKMGYVNRKVKEEKTKLKEELGLGWQFKAQSKLAAEDLNRLVEKVRENKLLSSASAENSPKSLPKATSKKNSKSAKKSANKKK